jgi:hypothetical protein
MKFGDKQKLCFKQVRTKYPGCGKSIPRPRPRPSKRPQGKKPKKGVKKSTKSCNKRKWNAEI